MKHQLKQLAAGVALACTAGLTQGALFSFQDDDIDYIVRQSAPGGPLAVVPIGPTTTANPILIGDYFVAAFEVPTATKNGTNLIPNGQELTGIGALQLLACTAGQGGPATSCQAPGAVYVFGAPSVVGLNAIIALGGGQTVGAAGNPGGGASLAFFLNGTAGDPDRNIILDRSLLGGATNCTSYGDCVNQVTLGSLYQLDGFNGDPDNFWISFQLAGGGDINDIAAAGNTTPISFSQFGLGNFSHADGVVGFINVNTGLPCNSVAPIADGCVQFLGSATVTGGQGLSNGAFAHSDFDADKFTTEVPEPATLALLGLGLLGIAGLRRARA